MTMVMNRCRYASVTIISVLIILTLTFPMWDLLLGDGFADDLEIPQGVDFRKPLSLEDSRDMNKIDWNSLTKSIPLNTQFDLIDVPGNGGIYKYGVWYDAPEKGHLYIRVYEYTKNQELSKNRLREKSRSYVSPQAALEFYIGEFTVYEGDWGEYYAVRVELWFDPVSSNRDFKVLENNYIIQGWMR